MDQFNVQLILDKMEAQLEKQTSLITERVTANISIIIENKLKPILDENKKLKSEVSLLQQKILATEREVRKNNIILHGIEETENNHSDTLGLVLQTFNAVTEKANLELWDKWEISSARRLGKKDGEKKRPILITTTLEWRKYELLKNKKLLPENIFVTEDFPKEILNKRRELNKQRIEEIKKGNLAYIRYDKLIIHNSQKPTDKRKRSPTKSPSSRIETPLKINKTNKLEHIGRYRSSSLSDKPKKPNQ